MAQDKIQLYGMSPPVNADEIAYGGGTVAEAISSLISGKLACKAFNINGDNGITCSVQMANCDTTSNSRYPLLFIATRQTGAVSIFATMPMLNYTVAERIAGDTGTCTKTITETTCKWVINMGSSAWGKMLAIGVQEYIDRLEYATS